MIPALLILIASGEDDGSLMFIISTDSPIISAGFTSNPTDTLRQVELSARLIYTNNDWQSDSHNPQWNQF
jgi:uncharacterized protein YfaT (DUF1175 family)